MLIPLLFSGSLLQPALWTASLVAFLVFCLLSSAVYCVNDVLDAAADRRHPRKRHRPIASGNVRPGEAIVLAVALLVSALGLGYGLLPGGVLLFAGLYLSNSLLYCCALKHRVIIDVLTIAIGFVLRIQAGCAAIGVAPTSWILVCGFSLALVLGFGKRRLEIGALQETTEFRPVLVSYSPEKVNLLLAITTSICLLAYMLYTVAPESIRLHQTDKLVYTVPFVAYGLFRYLFKVQEGKHDGPVEVMLSDPVFALNGVLWVLTVIAVLYFPIAVSHPTP